MEQQKKRNGIIQRFFNWCLNVNIYEKYNDTDKAFFIRFAIKSFVLFVSFFLSFVYGNLFIIPIIVLSLIFLSESPINNLYYFCFIVSYCSVVEGISYSLVIVFIFLFLKIVRDIINKKISLSWSQIIIVLIPIIYVLLPIGTTKLTLTYMTCTYILLIFFTLLYKSNISLLRIVFSLSIGILSSVLIGFIGMIFKNLFQFHTAFYYPNNYFRFTATMIDCNFLASIILIALTGLIILFYKKEINFLFYILYTIFLMLLILTGSKMSFLIFVLVFIVFIGYLIFEKCDAKQKVLKILTIIVLTLTSSMILFNHIRVMFNRFSNPGVEYESNNNFENGPQNNTDNNIDIFEGENSDEIVVEIKDYSVWDKLLNSKVGHKLSVITTYRFDLFIGYCEYLFEHPVELLFGRGEGTPKLVISTPAGDVQDSHNVFVDIVYNFGLFFLLYILILFVFFLIKEIKVRRINLLNLLPLFSALVTLFSLNIIWNYLSILLILIGLFVIFKNDKKEALK